LPEKSVILGVFHDQLWREGDVAFPKPPDEEVVRCAAWHLLRGCSLGEDDLPYIMSFLEDVSIASDPKASKGKRSPRGAGVGKCKSLFVAGGEVPPGESAGLDAAGFSEGLPQSPAGGGGGDASAPGPVLTVSKWEELGIGIDADGKYLAITPTPELGAVFPREKAVTLDLPGKQWESLLDLLARSKNGDTADKQDVMLAFGYLEKGMGNPEDFEELRLDQQKMRTVKAASGRLAAAVRDLGRKLRAKVNVNEKSSNNSVLSVKEQGLVRAHFVVRHLVRDGNGKLVFGSAT
jgi:hypothetical protein